MPKTVSTRAVLHSRNAVRNLEKAVAASNVEDANYFTKQQYERSSEMLELWQFILKAVEAYDEIEA